MKTTYLLIAIEHPDTETADGLIEHAIRPVLNDISADAGDWSVTIKGETDLRDRALRSAIALALSDFPDEWDNEKILEAIVDKHDDIVVWQTFEYWDGDDIVNYIEETAETIYSTYF